MAGEVEPEALRDLLNTAERPRTANWSLRAALTRYGQGQPQRASDVIGLVRRIEGALKPYAKVLGREGPKVWAAVDGGDPNGGDADVDALLVDLLRALARLDEVGDALAAWAADTSRHRPDEAVGDAVAAVASTLDGLGVARETEGRGPRNRGV